ncbi:MAG: hypothetical protein LBS55_03120 [Prevotellaceae bacterium]|jgi:hypothetical protein|nr:hypothetical protein [Prevotellaceae bacterium]
MNKFFISLILAALCFQFMMCNRSVPKCCTPESTAPILTSSWKDELKTEIPLLGHRNWIVVTDMAYPLQTQPGIKTVYTNEAYMDILDFVYKEIEAAPHIKAMIYQDKELLYLNETDAAGIDVLRGQMTMLFGDNRTFVPHEELINRLDEISRKFNVVILKSNLIVPYTSTFFELDCNYWDSAREKKLQQTIAKDK